LPARDSFLPGITRRRLAPSFAFQSSDPWRLAARREKFVWEVCSMHSDSLSRRTFLEAAAALAALPAERLAALPSRFAARPAEGSGLDFPIVDYHVHVLGDMTAQRVLELARERGVKIGVAQHGGLADGMQNDDDMRRFLARWEGKPVYRGMQGDGLKWPKMFSTEMIAKLDYVLADAMIFPEKDGRMVELWTPAAVVPDPEDFMERYVAYNLRVMNEQPIDILASASFLPEAIVADYDRLWTSERMEKVIECASRLGVALEISGMYKIPSKKFILKAKSAGVKFSFGSNTQREEVGRIEYSIRMARECGFTARDMFTPAPYDQKPVIRRG
jgi:histidinol phosphatase-like PHP family hydrolase